MNRMRERIFKPGPLSWQTWMTQWTELLEAGIATVEALALSIEIGGPKGTPPLIQKTVVLSLEKIHQGNSLSQAFEQSNPQLPQEIRMALICAEVSGALADDLRNHLERWRSMSAAQKEFKKSMAYPMFVLFCSVLCWWFLEVHAQATPTAQDPAQAGFSWSDCLLALGLPVLFLLGLQRFARKNRTPGTMHTWGWLPGQALEVSNFFFLIASELDAGVDLVHSLRKRSMTRRKTVFYKGHTHTHLTLLGAQIQRGVQQGKRLSESIAQTHAPLFLLRHAQLAEQTGELSRCFHLAAKVYELEAKRRLERMKSILGPLTLGLAALTLITAYQSTMAPLYDSLGNF